MPYISHITLQANYEGSVAVKATIGDSELSLGDGSGSDEASASVTVPLMDDLDTYIRYAYEKKFGVPYRELGWWLEPGAKEFVKELEADWAHNKLDFHEAYRDRGYVEFATRRAIETGAASLDEAIEGLLDDIEVMKASNLTSCVG